MIIGREKEQKKLRELYEGEKAEFIAVYGRRRIGKTYLIDEVFQNKITFRHAGLSPIGMDNGNSEKKTHMKEQLEHFHHSLLMHGMKECNPPASWLEAFYMLEQFLTTKDDQKSRLLVFLDEIQWMDTPKAGFITGLEAFWNGWACFRHNIMLIVCGSSTSWILDKLINNHGGLYGRLTREIELQPFSLGESEQFFLSKGFAFSRYDIAQIYMTVGGIPYYFNYFDRELSVSQNIQSIFFDKGAPLKNEFDRLFFSLFTNPEVMKSIVLAINSKNRGLTRNELLEKTGIADSGNFSKQLKALESGSFIMKYDSFGNGKKETFYKLTDPFCIFSLRFVRDSSPRKKKEWSSIAASHSIVTWYGLAFENLCFNHIRQIKAALGISGVITDESLWSKRGTDETEGTQIDLIIERSDHVINMCEIKFYSEEFTADRECHFSLERRHRLLRDIVSPKTSIYNTLITTFGLRRVEYFGDFMNVITLDDLFKAM